MSWVGSGAGCLCERVAPDRSGVGSPPGARRDPAGIKPCHVFLDVGEGADTLVCRHLALPTSPMHLVPLCLFRHHIGPRPWK
jgi:hypothetical protein